MAMADPNQNGIRRHLDLPSQLVIFLTLVLFAAALLVKGIGHDLLLEGGMFLVSVKLIMMAYKGSVANERLLAELQALRDAVTRLGQKSRDSHANDGSGST